METQTKQETGLENVAKDIGLSIAKSVLGRVEGFQKRETVIREFMRPGLAGVPTQILWQGLEDEGAPVFVVYKLLHEAFSNGPQFFRRFITGLMAAQRDRFSAVFSRETLWSVVARAPRFDVPDDFASAAHIRRFLEALNKKSFWRRSEAELDQEAETLSEALAKGAHGGFRRGVEALRRLQLERATGLTYGNLKLFVPAKLSDYAARVTELGMNGRLPALDELGAKLHEIVRDPLADGGHESVPIDILFSDLEGDSLEVFVLVREKASEGEQKTYRRASLLVRYFLKYAFNAYEMENLKVRLAFYLDQRSSFAALRAGAQLFHPEEIVSYHDFWALITGRKDGAELVAKARDAAVGHLRGAGLMGRIKAHFDRARKSADRAQGPQGVLFDGAAGGRSGGYGGE